MDMRIKGDHWEKNIFNYFIPRPNVFIDMQHVLMHDYILFHSVLGHVTFCVPKSLMHDSLIRGIHHESVMLHENCFETYMEHETLRCFDKWIVHKRDKSKNFVHSLKTSFLVYNFHWIHLVV